MYPDLKKMCQFYHLSPWQLCPNALRSWNGIRVLCTLLKWEYSPSLFQCFFQLCINQHVIPYFSATWSCFKKWRVKSLDRDTIIKLVNGVQITNSNYWKQYFLFKGSVLWDMRFPDWDVDLAFDELFAHDKKLSTSSTKFINCLLSNPFTRLIILMSWCRSFQGYKLQILLQLTG